MSAKLTLRYEAGYPAIGPITGHISRFTVERDFLTHEVLTTDILDAYEELLRAAGFNCPYQSLDIVVDEPHGSS